VKCAVVERAQHAICDRLYKYFTYKNTFLYIDVLPKFFRAYNDTVHSATGMAPSRMTGSDVLAIWNRMRRRRHIGVAKVIFSVGQHVRISKEKMNFAKGDEQYFSAEVFPISRLIARGFKQDADRGTILRGGTHTFSHLERDLLQDR